MSRSQIFISHISEEADFANCLKEWIEETLLGSVSVFVSSDKGESIPLGSEWLRKIKKSLESSNIVLVLMSNRSKTKKWIYFESGAGYVRGIPVIPICIGGLSKNDLPVPLNLLQAMELPNSENEIELLKLIASSANLRTPKNFASLNLPHARIVTESPSIEPKITNKNFIDSIYLDEIKLKILEYLLSNINSLPKFSLSDLEVKLNLKAQKKRKYILKNLEDFNQLNFVKKIREGKSTFWEITTSGILMLKKIKEAHAIRPI